jgi:hypothetical protein
MTSSWWEDLTQMLDEAAEHLAEHEPRAPATCHARLGWTARAIGEEEAAAEQWHPAQRLNFKVEKRRPKAALGLLAWQLITAPTWPAAVRLPAGAVARGAMKDWPYGRGSNGPAPVWRSLARMASQGRPTVGEAAVALRQARAGCGRSVGDRPRPAGAQRRAHRVLDITWLQGRCW